MHGLMVRGNSPRRLRRSRDCIHCTDRTRRATGEFCSHLITGLQCVHPSGWHRCCRALPVKRSEFLLLCLLVVTLVVLVTIPRPKRAYSDQESASPSIPTSPPVEEPTSFQPVAELPPPRVITTNAVQPPVVASTNVLDYDRLRSGDQA